MQSTPRLELILSHLTPTSSSHCSNAQKNPQTMHNGVAYTVFCGSAPGNDPVYAEAADQLARAMAKAGSTLI